MAHQPAISFSISLQNQFNRAGGRTFNVRYKIMRLLLIAFLATSGFVSADETAALRKIYAERDQELRAKIEAAEDELARVTQKVASLKVGLGTPQKSEFDPITVEVREEGIFVNGVAKTPEELQEALRQISAVRPQVYVRFISKADTDWSKILPALTACYDAKVWLFDFQLVGGNKEDGKANKPAQTDGDKPSN